MIVSLFYLETRLKIFLTTFEWFSSIFTSTSKLLTGFERVESQMRSKYKSPRHKPERNQLKFIQFASEDLLIATKTMILNTQRKIFKGNGNAERKK